MVKRYREGGWHVFEAKTSKPFEHFKRDATRSLMHGLASIVTWHRWEDKTCHISTFGANGTVEFDHGNITCRVMISFPTSIFEEKILSDIESATIEASGSIDPTNRDVFIVHGHDVANKTELKDFLRKLNLKPIVLDEEDDRGLTIIEKFEYYASSCGFAFVLMTPDDRSEESDEIRWRARQNVIMELGWFIARLGRKRVVILYTGKPEIPSDISGVVYLRFDKSVNEISEKIRQRLRGEGLVS